MSLALKACEQVDCLTRPLGMVILMRGLLDDSQTVGSKDTVTMSKALIHVACQSIDYVGLASIHVRPSIVISSTSSFMLPKLPVRGIVHKMPSFISESVSSVVACVLVCPSKRGRDCQAMLLISLCGFTGMSSQRSQEVLYRDVHCQNPRLRQGRW